MIKKWATVVHWHNGRATLCYNSNSICDGCFICSSCRFCIFNKIVPKINYQLELSISQPLIIGQKVEVGILEGSLLRLAMLVYITPLFGLFITSGIMEFLFSNQLIIFLGAIFGVSISFFLLKRSCLPGKKKLYILLLFYKLVYRPIGY